MRKQPSARNKQDVLPPAIEEGGPAYEVMRAGAESDFFSRFDLDDARRRPSKKDPASHQQAALAKLNTWFRGPRPTPAAGGIVVLPTGGGKTFTAVRFLCHGPLSHGYKVLWLAHTHHLLEQAYESFAPIDPVKAAKGTEVGLIAEPRSTLAVRVVSGIPGHFPVSTVTGSDDVLIVTLQTLVRAWEHRTHLHGLSDFFASAGEKLFVVFDEAHHAPAPGYRALIEGLRAQHQKMFLLGLTATPTHNDKRKKGWLSKLFPQEILYQVSASKLIAAGVLAKPIFERTNTDVTPTFTQRDFEKWIGTYRDIPESVIETLAQNKERNTLIAETYVKDRKRYGKTIIFAERWHQCEFLVAVLRKRGVRAGAVYSYTQASETTVRERNNRGKDENARVLDAFKKDELDVIVNVRMLTEGTDVPSVNTVFLTRETTSQILATQMVGRALRGPKFGGTDNAFIVSFTDNWQHRINFADYRQLEHEATSDEPTEYEKRPPLHLISIELIRRLSQSMDSGLAVSPGPFLTLIPVGWYQTQYESVVQGTDDTETIRDMIMVFDGGQAAYKSFIDHLKVADLTGFASENITLDAVKPTLEKWSSQFFANNETCHREELLKSVLDLARHMAQNDRQAPKFYLFEERAVHDLDEVARTLIDSGVGLREIPETLETEYLRADRFWPTLYSNFERFKSQHDQCVNRLTSRPQASSAKLILPGRDRIPNREPTEEVKLQVKRRDGFVCLCCGENNRRLLQIDHVAPSYVGGGNSQGNLQTLCKNCNQTKGINTLNFRVQHNQCLTNMPEIFPDFELPLISSAKDAVEWKQFLQRTINFHYRCAAVCQIHIGARGRDFYEWRVELCDGNDPAWLVPHIKPLVLAIRERIQMARSDGFVMQRLIVQAPNKKTVAWPVRSQW